MPEELTKARTLPHNLDAERSVLGAVLLDNHAFNAAGEVLTADDFYGEAHKFRSDSDRDMLVDRLRNKWGSKVVESLQKVKGIEPTLSDDGKQAVFEIDSGNSFTLYKDEQGNWKFHL